MSSFVNKILIQIQKLESQEADICATMKRLKDKKVDVVSLLEVYRGYVSYCEREARLEAEKETAAADPPSKRSRVEETSTSWAQHRCVLAENQLDESKKEIEATMTKDETEYAIDEMPDPAERTAELTKQFDELKEDIEVMLLRIKYESGFSEW